MQAVKVYNMREVDELVFLDITASIEGRLPDFETVDEIADECFMPLTVGGGIRSVEDVRRLLQVGADKVAINTAAAGDSGLVSAVAAEFGSQCVVASIDARRSEGGWTVATHSGTVATDKDPISFARTLDEQGAGEILLTSIDRDGTMSGYDLELIRSVAEAVSIPVIASGGAGNYEDMLSAVVHGKASAVAAASIFHFTEQTPLEAKRFLASHGVPVRL
jgi:cyclase